MYFVMNEHLSLRSPAAEVGAREVSWSFAMPDGDNAVSITIVVIVVSGANPGMVATLEVTNDDENWLQVGDLTFPVTVGTVFGLSGLLSGRRYRLNWLFGSFTNPAACIISANVETAHV